MDLSIGKVACLDGVGIDTVTDCPILRALSEEETHEYEHISRARHEMNSAEGQEPR